MAYHFHHWDSVYFQEGKEFGLRLKNNAKLPTDGQYISSTPYPEEDFSKVLPFQYGAHLSYYGYSFLDIK